MSQTFKEVDSGIPAAKAAEAARQLSTGSWERGTCAEALLELYNPELSVFAPDPFPGGGLPHAGNPQHVASLEYAARYIRTDSETLQHDNVGVSDPASIGVAAELLGVVDQKYANAAQRQAEYLLKKASRYSNGAISHRHDVVELWTDYGYMAPPFLAYHAVAADSTDVLRAAIEQCKLHREVLITKSTGRPAGLWQHIIGPQHEDLGFWSTSNGWAAAGMARVLALLLKWPKSRGWTEEAQALKYWIREIIHGSIRTDDEASTEMLRNYLDDSSWWGEVSGTALLASVVYRMAVLAPEMFGEDYLEWAHRKRDAVAKHVDRETGIGAPTVNPRSHLQREKLLTGSPEGQSFLVLLHAAYRDWVNCNS